MKNIHLAFLALLSASSLEAGKDDLETNDAGSLQTLTAIKQFRATEIQTFAFLEDLSRKGFQETSTLDAIEVNEKESAALEEVLKPILEFVSTPSQINRLTRVLDQSLKGFYNYPPGQLGFDYYHDILLIPFLEDSAFLLAKNIDKKNAALSRLKSLGLYDEKTVRSRLQNINDVFLLTEKFKKYSSELFSCHKYYTHYPLKPIVKEAFLNMFLYPFSLNRVRISEDGGSYLCVRDRAITSCLEN